MPRPDTPGRRSPTRSRSPPSSRRRSRSTPSKLGPVQLRLLARRGEYVHTTIENAQTLVADARAGIQAAFIAMALAAVAELFMASGRPEQARRLLAEVDEADHDDAYYIAYLPGLVRVAVALESAELSPASSAASSRTRRSPSMPCVPVAPRSASQPESTPTPRRRTRKQPSGGASSETCRNGRMPSSGRAAPCGRWARPVRGPPAPGSSRALRVDGLRSGARRGRRPSGARQGRGAMTIKPRGSSTARPLLQSAPPRFA